MENLKDIIQIGIDAYRGKPRKYSVDESLDVLHKALVEANHGHTCLDPRDIRDGKCGEVFTIVETILSKTTVEGLQGDEYFNQLVDFRNIPLGDRNQFVVEDDILFTVSDASRGTQGIRRQRLGGRSTHQVTTSYKTVKIYEELDRVLSGAVDFNTMINSVSQSFQRQLLDEIYMLWNAATAADFGGVQYFPAAGTFDPDVLLNIVNHVEAAANGKPAHIICTKTAARKLAPFTEGNVSLGDLYNIGYYTKFYGVPVVVTTQRHKVNSTDFVFEDDVFHVMAGDDKPIKCVYEGQSIIIPGTLTSNADLTQDYLYGDMYGMDLILSGGNAGMGRYKFTD